MNESHPVLVPRSTWPWPDLDAKLASVTASAAAGADLRRPLWPLTWPLVRRTNLGFITALVHRGVAVDQDVVLKTRRLLDKLADRDTTTPSWPRYARWLAELDHTAAVDLLRRQALTRPGPQRYPAWEFLHEISPEDSVRVAETLVADSAVTRETRFRIGGKLAAFDVDTALRAFDRAARGTNGTVRNQAIEFIRLHAPDRALDLSAQAAADPLVDDVHRLEASRQVLAHDRDRGLDLHFALLTTTRNASVRTALMDDLRREVPKRLATRLDELHRTGQPAARPDFGRYLRKHLGGGPEVTVTLATDPSQTPEAQFHALKSDPQAATADLVKAVVLRFTKHSRDKVDALALLAKLSPDDAFDLLRDILGDKGLRYSDRIAAVAPSAKHLGPQRTVDLYLVLARETGASREQRDAAATAVAKIDKTEVRALYEELARDPDASVDDYVYFLGKTGRSLEHLRKAAVTAGPRQLRAAQEAATQGTEADKAHLRKLLASPSFPYPEREPVIGKLPRADRVVVYAAIVVNGFEDAGTRLSTVKALGRLDKAKAAEVVNTILDDPKVPRSINSQARNAARAFR